VHKGKVDGAIHVRGHNFEHGDRCRIKKNEVVFNSQSVRLAGG
jgi:hypothetical protein